MISGCYVGRGGLLSRPLFITVAGCFWCYCCTDTRFLIYCRLCIRSCSSSSNCDNNNVWCLGGGGVSACDSPLVGLTLVLSWLGTLAHVSTPGDSAFEVLYYFGKY